MRAGHFTGYGDLTPLLDAEGNRRWRRCLVWRIPLWEFRNSNIDPLTYHAPDGTCWQPDRHFATDGGSVPPFLWAIPGLNPWAFPRAYPFHDSGFAFGGLYERRSWEAQYHFVRLDRLALNAMLTDMIGADGGSLWDRARIAAGVALGSRWAWDEDAQASARGSAGIEVYA
jgi:hypothetical protein